MKSVICFGTRPEWLKVKPLLESSTRFKTLFTGQHSSLINGINFDFEIEINESSNRLDSIIANSLEQFPEEQFESVLVQGDTASAFACALAAFHRKIPIIHLEAGLRSYDLCHPYPEEGYRQLISRIADVHLCPTELSKSNLMSENPSGQIHVVGNSILDSLLPYKGQEYYGNKILVTLHRRENQDSMSDWFNAIEAIAIKYPKLEFIIPVHPNPEIQAIASIFKKVQVVPALEHHELLQILMASKLIISDSGGIQEEGSFFNKKVLVCRETTERPEGVGTGHLHLCPTPNSLKQKFDVMIEDFEISQPCPYGDGNTATNVNRILNDYNNS